jgi:hypothetical protein
LYRFSARKAWKLGWKRVVNPSSYCGSKVRLVQERCCQN